MRAHVPRSWRCMQVAEALDELAPLSVREHPRASVGEALFSEQRMAKTLSRCDSERGLGYALTGVRRCSQGERPCQRVPAGRVVPSPRPTPPPLLSNTHTHSHTANTSHL